MKRLPIIAFFCIVLFKSIDIKASHMAGGEITWLCLPNGQYVFKMEIYRECSGTMYFFNNQNINYQGGSILMKPDSNRWLTYGGDGNISHEGPTGCQRSCNNPAEVGAMQFFPFISDPVNLSGVPPPGGWLFTWTLCCRPSSIVNLVQPSSKSFTLRARMYPHQGGNTTDCYDSSPHFLESPAVLVCKGNEFIYNHTVGDRDLDSLVFSWAQPWHMPNVPISFKTGYAYDDPMPDSSVHPLNQAAVLNSQSGEIRFATFSGQSGQQYTTTLQVDAYKRGIKKATVYRDIPFIIYDCPALPGIGMTNHPPTATVNGLPAIGFVDTVFAGEKVILPFQSVESDIVYTDPLDSTTAQLQQNYVSPSGFLFSNDFVDPSACALPGISPCATLNPAPTINPLNGEYELTAMGGTVNTTFEWQTNCSYLTIDSSGYLYGKTYNFTMKTYDDHCDVPGVIYPSISIHVERYSPTIQKNGNVLIVDSADSYQWFFNGTPIGNSDTNQFAIQAFGKYSVEVMKFGCPSKRVDYQFINTSLKENSWLEDITIYPNPFRDVFTVEIPLENENELEFQLFDLNGREIEAKLHNVQEKHYIEATKTLRNGVYLIKISSKTRSVLRKVVKM